MFIFISWAVLVRAIILFIVFAAKGGHSFLLGIKSICLRRIHYFFLAFFNPFCLHYLSKPQQKKYIIGWVLLLLIQFFSFQRSQLIISLIVNAFIFLFYYIRKMNISKKIITLILVLLGIFILPIIISNVSPAAKVYVDRYLDLITCNSTIKANTDSGHFDQSKMTTQAALKLGYWGVAYGNKLVLEGAFEI
jgi:hypothetical protein